MIQNETYAVHARFLELHVHANFLTWHKSMLLKTQSKKLDKYIQNTKWQEQVKHNTYAKGDSDSASFRSTRSMIAPIRRWEAEIQNTKRIRSNKLHQMMKMSWIGY
jgi:hypothetical protein